MKLIHAGTFSFAVAIAVLPLSAEAAQAEPKVVVTPVLSAVTTAAGQPIRLPAGDARVIVSTYVIAPGARLPNHRHRYPRYAYVLQGRLRVTDLDRGRSFTYKQGDLAIEVVNDLHYGVNTGTTPLRLLVMDFVPKALTKNTLP